MASSAEYSLIYGMLALQMSFVSRDELVAAFSVWVGNKSRDLAAVLRERRVIDADTSKLLDQLVRKQIAQGPAATAETLATLTRHFDDVAQELASLSDGELNATLSPVRTRVASDSRRGSDQAAKQKSPARSAAERFQLLRLHAQGGLGEVWLAEDADLHRQVALKEIKRRHADQLDSRLRFVQEAEITGALEHPGVVPVYALGQYADGRPFYAMRFIRGVSLQQAIANHHGPKQDPTIEKPIAAPIDGGADDGAAGNGESASTANPSRLTQRQLLSRFVNVCETIAYAHSRGVLHRDLKPDNIMLGDYGETLVVDWGLAKTGAAKEPSRERHPIEASLHVAGSTPTQLGSAMGTPSFMSPEQSRGEIDRLGPATDIYSLGATLYCLLTGQAPFTDPNVARVLDQVRYGRFPAPRAIAAATPPGLEAICLKAMSLEASQRYPSARALADDVERFLADEPLAARVDAYGERVARWMRRHRSYVQAGAAALLLVAVVATTAVLLIAQSRSRAVRLAADNAQLAAAESAAKTEAQQRQQEAEQATGLAQQQRERAEHFYQVALSTVDDFLTGVSNDERLKQAGLETLRRDLLTQARDFYDLVLKKADEGDDPLWEERGLAHRRLAEIHHEIGEHQAAIKEYHAALDMYRNLMAKHPEDGGYATDFGVIVNNLALSYAAAGNRDEALRLRRTVIDLVALLLQAKPGDAELLGYQGMAQLNLAIMLADTEPAAAIELGEAAKRSLDEALRKSPDDLDLWDSVGYASNNLGSILLRRERYDEAEKELQAAQAAWGKLLDAETGSEAESLRSKLALVALNQAAIAAARQNHAEARRLIEQGLAFRQQLAVAHPDVAAYQSLLADLRQSAGKLYRDLQLYQESAREYRQSIQIYEELRRRHPETPAYPANLASLHAEIGMTLLLSGSYRLAENELATAIDTAVALAAEHGDQPEYRHALATARYYLGLVNAEAGQNEAAAERLEEAAADFAAVAPHYQKTPQLLATLAECQESIGTLHGPLLLDHPELAARWWTLAKESATRLLAPPDRDLAAPSTIVAALRTRADALSGLEEFEASLADWNEVLQLGGGKLDFQTGVGKATTMFRMRRFDDALLLARETAAGLDHAALVNTIGRELAFAAGTLPKMSLAADEQARLVEAYALEAMGMLGRARALGYFQNRDAIAFLQEDKYLDALRQRDDFRAFVAELKAR